VPPFVTLDLDGALMAFHRQIGPGEKRLSALLRTKRGTAAMAAQKRQLRLAKLLRIASLY